MIDWEGLLDLQEAITADPAYASLQTEGIRYVGGIGAERPKAFVVGEAPGALENTRGEPFVGASGRALTDLMSIAGLYARDSYYHPELKVNTPVNPNVWLTNAVKFRPPGNRTPNVREIMAATKHLRAEYRCVGKPRLIVCVGRVAAQALGQIGPYPRNGDIWPLGKEGKAFVCYQYHPAFGLRNGPNTRAMIQRQWEEMAVNIQEMREELEW